MTIVANVKPLPAYVRRITTADVAHGETNHGFHIWPTARPAISIEPGERLAIALRIRSLAADAGSLKLGPDAPVSWKLRREANGDYWLDIPIEGSGSRAAPLVVVQGETSQEIGVQVSVTAPSENIVVTPVALDFGEQTLADLRGAVQRFGIRKIVGVFHIKLLSSTLPFIKFQQSTMIDGSNYLIKVTIDQTKPLKPGAYEGAVVIDTDEGHRVEVPIKLKLVDR